MQTDITRNRHKGAAASRAAYARVRGYEKRLRTRIYNYLRAIPARTDGRDGLTVEQIAVRLRLRYTTVSARVSQLKAAGLVEDSGHCRLTTSGSEASVVRVIDRRRAA